MKRIFGIFSMVVALFFSSCIEQDYALWEGSLVEFQQAVVLNPVAGQTFPRVTVPNTQGSVNLQVNFVSAHRANDEVITYKVVPEGTTAVAGTDYTITGTATIPANSSFATVTVNIVNTGAIGGSVDLLLELEGNATIQPSERYKQVQVRITRPNPPAEG
ncbi:DUF4843 domain-containing protein [Mongoliitalea daihaiensis]|uniref:DUF4843 domain-containing protein n=1 Tax=Mongoliitalea daihaiensis TaxID=2782006 RepID=UPI001F3ACE20|nr:DUF4843 domain-containing protein [Mongoliitalea daihaiensis]UJP65205.1 DUF4843 domain-containing protein [Mongoliitalea daihaiensis]